MSNRTLNLDAGLYQYLLDASPPESQLLKELREVTAKDNMSRMQIAPEQGHLLSFLVKLTGARKIIEIGTYTGYSAICMASALPQDGQLICCDISKEWTTIARSFWDRAGLAQKVQLKLAPAEETLAALISQGQKNRFDQSLCFMGGKCL